MKEIRRIHDVELTRRGDELVGVVSYRPDGKKPKEKAFSLSSFSAERRTALEQMPEGVPVTVDISLDRNNQATVVFRDPETATLQRPPRPRDAGHTGSVDAVVRTAFIPRRPPRPRNAEFTESGFVNPYTFVPPLRRDTLPAPFADAPFTSHAALVPQAYSGFLSFTLEAVSPVLLPELDWSETADSCFDKEGRLRLRTRVGHDGVPVLRGSEVKGVLRTAYEIITASRMGVFRGHDKQLAYRGSSTMPQRLRPARVEVVQERPQLRLFGPSKQSTAWLPVAHTTMMGTCNGKQLIGLHGRRLYARMRKYRYGHGAKSFEFWRVTHLWEHRDEVGDYTDFQSHTYTLLDEEPRYGWGYVCANGQNIGGKHDERFFIESDDDQWVELPECAVRTWQHLIDSYIEAARTHDPPDGCQRSRHVVQGPDTRRLPDGTLLYAQLDSQGSPHALYPVLISRELFDRPPEELLPPTRRPATDMEQLSLADRVFGVVPQRPDEEYPASGYRGRLSVVETGCETADWQQPGFPAEGVVMAPLSSPKPSQFRFYGSPSEHGEPYERGVDKSAGYSDGHGLRGTKVYRWRDRDPGYWDPGTDGIREWVAPEVNPTQVCRWSSWVRKGSRFRVRLRVEGLSEHELGALVWLLSLLEPAALRLGGGKPLGFGVVRPSIDWDQTQIFTDAAMRCRWLGEKSTTCSQDEVLRTKAAYQRAVDADPVLRCAVEDFVAASKPVESPVHYPRQGQAPEAETYEWFVANERVGRNRGRNRHALPAVWWDNPMLPKNPNQ
ncbi:MAG: TIGR03986 family CRISPR-associated RAMP protein [Micrococcales bacterium]|nr:MAG: TIGR03986 family CRISPR-associated RAMP protein [Micrococcales bacterium]